MRLEYESLGLIRSPYQDLEGMPIQPSGAKGVRGRIEMEPQYEPGLSDLDGFSHLILLYHFHLVTEPELKVTPFLDQQPRGIFATRAPKRPNPIGLSVVELISVKGSVLHIQDVDILDRTPILDLKPYVPEFDQAEGARTGWLQRAALQVDQARSDSRFR